MVPGGRWRRVATIATAWLAAAACGAGADIVSAQVPPEAAAVRPFKIAVPEAVLTDLKERLRRTRFPDERAGSGWSQGTSLAYMKELIAYWRDTFDWRAQEQRLNQFPQFTTTIDGMTVHFIHVESKERHALPLLLTHGWPGSFVEFVAMIGPLTDPVAHGGRAEDAFDVVIPSLPGFGFSSRPSEAGWTGGRENAELWSKLMARLGYARYGVQGGDIGSGVSAQVAALEPTHVVGLHMNMCLAGNGSSNPPPGLADPLSGLSQLDLDRLKANDRWWLRKPPTCRCRAPSRKRLATASTTLRPDWRHGSRKSSGRGATATATRRPDSRK